MMAKGVGVVAHNVLVDIGPHRQSFERCRGVGVPNRKLVRKEDGAQARGVGTAVSSDLGHPPTIVQKKAKSQSRM